jgi:hypothetical protein
MEQWLEEKERGTVLSARVTVSERQAVDRLRKTLRMRTRAHVVRFGLQLVEAAVSMADVQPLGEDEQVKVLRKFAETVQEKDDAYLRSEEAAEDMEEFIAELLGVSGEDSRTPQEEEVSDTEPSLFADS